MKLWHGFMAVSKKMIQLNSTWRNFVTLAKGSLGKAETDPQPSNRLHWTDSVDGKIVLFEGTFNLDVLDDEVKTVNSQVFARGEAIENSRVAAVEFIESNQVKFNDPSLEPDSSS